MGARAGPWSSTRACALALLLVLVLALVAAGASGARTGPGGAARAHGGGGGVFAHGAKRSLLQRVSCCTSDGSTKGTACCPAHAAAAAVSP
ncbi:unnamed protein product [Urochloa decumbens]|uniref:Uncharacterized protein n=1 Tax=Urochloa decumbens TaxID=240449 RepID=A0ABC8YJW4_9POAL